MNTSNLTTGLTSLPILGVFASIGLFYQHVKTFLLKVIRIIIKKREVPRKFGNFLYFDLIKNGRFFGLDDYKIEDVSLFNMENKTYLPVVFKSNFIEIFLYKNFIPIFIKSSDRDIIFLYLKWTFPFEKFLVQSQISAHEDARNYINSFSSFRIVLVQGNSLKKSLKESSSNSSSENSKPSLMTRSDTVMDTEPIISPYHFFLRKTKNKFLDIDFNKFSWLKDNCSKNKFQPTKTFLRLSNQLENWLKAQEWYNDHNICWKRGIALNGTPGQGKSTLVLELAKKYNLPIYIFDLSTMDNYEFEDHTNKINNEAGIILFEDIDTCFKKRENLNKSKYGCLTFDCFINKLSGVNSIRNKFIFLTTNHLEDLDPALLREGRMDEIIKVEPLTYEEKINLASVILDNKKELIDEVTKDSENDSTAKFEEKCVSLALRSFWAK